MTCKHVCEFLDDYDAKRLDTLTRLRFLYHLGICHHCRRYLDSYRKTILVSKSAFTDDPSSVTAIDPNGPLGEVPEALVQAILRSRVA